MNKTKLTLTIRPNLIEAAKKKAQEMNMSLSEVVERYLERLSLTTKEESKTPVTDSIVGMIKPKHPQLSDDEAKWHYLKEKHNL